MRQEAAWTGLPFLVVEIVSPHAAATKVLERLHEFAAIGPPHIWVLETARRRAFTYSGHCLEEVTGDTISTKEPAIKVHLADLFRGL